MVTITQPMAHSFQPVVYMVGTPININGSPYGAEVGQVNTVTIKGDRYVFWTDVLHLFGANSDIQKILRCVQPIQGRTELVKIHKTLHPRILVPMSSLHQNMTMLRARLEKEDLDEDHSEKETPNSDDEIFIADDSSESISSVEEPYESFTDDPDSEELLVGQKRNFKQVTLRPAKYART